MVTLLWGLFGTIAVILTLMAYWRLLGRAGLSELWAFAALLPGGALVLLLVLAFRPWPGDPAYMHPDWMNKLMRGS